MTRPDDDAAPGDPDRNRAGAGPRRTVARTGRAAFEVRGSRFLGCVAPATDRAAAEEFLADRRADHEEATHVVPAYRVREDGFLRAYADDDGEPAGSAGDPALNVLERRDVEDVVAAVVRYYGGTNLGVGGLARAYSRAVKRALDDAGVVVRVPRERVVIVVDYDDSGTVRGLLESVAAGGTDPGGGAGGGGGAGTGGGDADGGGGDTPDDTGGGADRDAGGADEATGDGGGLTFEATYEEQVTFDCRVPVDAVEGVLDRVRSATGGRAGIDRPDGDDDGDGRPDCDDDGDGRPDGDD